MQIIVEAADVSGDGQISLDEVLHVRLMSKCRKTKVQTKVQRDECKINISVLDPTKMQEVGTCREACRVETWREACRDRETT